MTGCLAILRKLCGEHLYCLTTVFKGGNLYDFLFAFNLFLNQPNIERKKFIPMIYLSL